MIASNMSKKKYNLTQFENIKDNSYIPELNITSIKIINKISKKVGAPSYRKTPVFRKKRNDQEFNSNFTTTTFDIKNDENQINQDKIRELLNKITNNNYDELSEEIITNLQHFIYTQNDMVLMDFGKSIFEISSVNKFWVKLYAKLFNTLIRINIIYLIILMEQILKRLDMIDSKLELLEAKVKVIETNSTNGVSEENIVILKKRKSYQLVLV